MLPWFRMYHEARTDKKLSSLPCEQFRVWFNLLCFSAEGEDRGRIAGYDDDLLSVEVANGDVELLQATVERLIRLRILERDDDGALTFINFEKRQYDKPSDKPEATAERKRKQRERERQQAEVERLGYGVTPESRDVTPGHAIEGEGEVEGDRDVDEEPPSPPNARARAQENLGQFGVTPEYLDKTLQTFPEFVESVDALALDFATYHGASPPKSGTRAWLNWLKKQREFEHERASKSNGRGARPADRRGALDPASQTAGYEGGRSPYVNGKHALGVERI